MKLAKRYRTVRRIRKIFIPSQLKLKSVTCHTTTFAHVQYYIYVWWKTGKNFGGRRSVTIRSKRENYVSSLRDVPIPGTECVSRTQQGETLTFSGNMCSPQNGMVVPLRLGVAVSESKFAIKEQRFKGDECVRGT